MSYVVDGEFAPQTIETAAEIAETVRMPMARDADKIHTILSETDGVMVQFNSSWWGNEAFGVWGEWFFIHPDGVSPSGKALFVREGIKASDPVNKLRAYENIMSSKGGLTSKAARREKKKAFNWADDSRKLGPGMAPSDDRAYFDDGSCPISVLQTAFRLPESEDNLVFDSEGSHEGAMSEGDVTVTKTVQTRYGQKLVLAGDTYGAFSNGGDNLADEVSWDDTHLTFDGDAWVCDTDGVCYVIDCLVENGYTVAVDDSVKAIAEASYDNRDDVDAEIAESFGVDTE